METDNERQIREKIQDENWNTRMTALEVNWQKKIAETQEEFRHIFEKQNGNDRNPGSMQPDPV